MRRFLPTRTRGRAWGWPRRRLGWLAVWLQGRRRRRAVLGPLNAPVITNGGYDWDYGPPMHADVWITWSFEHGGHPVATLEVFASLNGGDYGLVDSVPSNTSGYTWESACESEALLEFQVRYRDGITFGPFSNVYAVEVQL